MSWLDETRLQIANRKAEQEAIAQAKKAEEAKRRAAKGAQEAKKRGRFVSDVNRRLPRGVELVGLVSYLAAPDPATERETGLTHHSTLRVHVGNGVQFDLVYKCFEGFQPGGGSSSTPLRLDRYELWSTYVYEAGSDHSSPSLLASMNRRALWNSDLEELLLQALEKHDAKRKTS